MKKVLVALLLCLLAFGCARKNLLSSDVQVSDNIMSRSIFMVVAENDQHFVNRGTAFAFIYNGKLGIMTAWHVLTMSKAKNLKVHGDGIVFNCGPFVQLGDNDIAWCETSIPASWIPLKKAEPAVNYGTLTAWGFPQTENQLISYIGEDNGPSLFKSDHHFMIRRVIGKAIPGMSGGPVLNSNGDVVAVVSHTGWPQQEYHYPVLIP